MERQLNSYNLSIVRRPLSVARFFDYAAFMCAGSNTPAGGGN
jgi:hypothetical protein